MSIEFLIRLMIIQCCSDKGYPDSTYCYVDLVYSTIDYGKGVNLSLQYCGFQYSTYQCFQSEILRQCYKLAHVVS